MNRKYTKQTPIIIKVIYSTIYISVMFLVYRQFCD
jgi:hypothetical protein